jgi:hypothetical protein
LAPKFEIRKSTPREETLDKTGPAPLFFTVPVLKNAAGVARVEGASLGPVPVLQDGKVDAP